MVDVSQPFHLTLINVCFAKFQSPTSKTTASDISKFFKPRSATKDRDDETAVNDVDDSRFDTSSQSHDSMTKDDTKSNKIPSVAKTGDAISKRLSRNYEMPSLSARTIPTSSYRESHDMKCSTYRQCSLSNESSRTCPKNERDVNASNVDAQPSPATCIRIVENKSSVGSRDVSPKKRISFFALKSDETHLEKDDRKRYLSAHFESETESQIRDTDDRNSAPAVDTGEYQLTTPSKETMHQSSDYDSRSFELLENTSKEHVEMRQSDDTSHCAIPPNVDPSVFAALPSDVRQELLNEWRKSGKGCAKESSHEATFLEFPDIDRTVFEELPPDVQKDVLDVQQKQKKRTLASLSPSHQRMITGKRPRTGKMLSEKGASKIKNKCIKDFFAPK